MSNAALPAHRPAGRLTRIDGRNVLRLTANAATEQLYARIARALARLIGPNR